MRAVGLGKGAETGPQWASVAIPYPPTDWCSGLGRLLCVPPLPPQGLFARVTARDIGALPQNPHSHWIFSVQRDSPLPLSRHVCYPCPCPCPLPVFPAPVPVCCPFSCSRTPPSFYCPCPCQGWVGCPDYHFWQSLSAPSSELQLAGKHCA